MSLLGAPSSTIPLEHRQFRHFIAGTDYFEGFVAVARQEEYRSLEERILAGEGQLFMGGDDRLYIEYAVNELICTSLTDLPRTTKTNTNKLLASKAIDSSSTDLKKKKRKGKAHDLTIIRTVK
ncbi:hypothetical protein N7491_006716 [Penicillium cf. griseofulvum]|uniref:Uncharacterized protein n=1 Tax=Penicillium cf. griseofulvum TaxID=2972120 RepID=A0A9W9IWF1_9EURO|nr:hypothetical protein N7472_010257 [Penicillium cf. griseofulvum]KAJ5429700.1 hypothetical protein N7491_006716 [Penicillium cf. griseofulvum]KAJ5436533.1 hypothetical protein N7445_007418 [Penicillium cf. griseofulvum]